MDTLAQIYERHRTPGDVDKYGCGDKGSVHSYIEQYEWLLAPYRKPGTVLMEVGIALGHSIAMWREYLPKGATVIGVEPKIVFDGKQPQFNDTVLIECDGTKSELLERLKPYWLDVVIDDASHMTNDQISTFSLLRHKMRPGGIYVIEDILALDAELPRYKALHPNLQIIDNRHVKGRFDDVLLVYRF